MQRTSDSHAVGGLLHGGRERLRCNPERRDPVVTEGLAADYEHRFDERVRGPSERRASGDPG